MNLENTIRSIGRKIKNIRIPKPSPIVLGTGLAVGLLAFSPLVGKVMAQHPGGTSHATTQSDSTHTATESNSRWGPPRPMNGDALVSIGGNQDFSDFSNFSNYTAVGWFGNQRGKLFVASADRDIDDGNRHDDFNLGFRPFPFGDFLCALALMSLPPRHWERHLYILNIHSD